MKKIVIVGSPGAGKSAIARQLGVILDIQVIHLDCYFWQNDWEETTSQKWITLQRHIIRQNAWIIDGCYHDTLDIRLDAADTVIFVDMPRLLCEWRVIKRHFRGEPRPDLRAKCPDRLNRAFLMKVWKFPDVDRGPLLKKIMEKESGKQFFWYRSKQEVSDFLDQMRGSYGPVQVNRIQIHNPFPLFHQSFSGRTLDL